MRINIAASFCLAMSLAGLTACGSSQTDAHTASVRTKLAPGSIGACLKRAGAARATTVDSLSFLADAEDNDEVSKPGIAYDSKVGAILRIWSQTPFEAQPPTWIVWIAQPQGESLSPFEIVEASPKRSYVMFVNRPTRIVRKRVNTCINFGHAHEPALHAVGPGTS
jgi:hypothetical protein